VLLVFLVVVSKVLVQVCLQHSEPLLLSAVFHIAAVAKAAAHHL